MTGFDTDTIVIGGGAMGSAAAWQLARRGIEVTLLERFEPGHHEGASHGALRNFNPSYLEPEYLALLGEAQRLWRELEAESGARLLSATGLIDHGPGPRADEALAAATGAGFEARLLSVAEASERWGGIRFDSRVLYFPEGGTVRAEDSVAAFQAVAAASGASVRHGARVVGIHIEGDDSVSVELESASGTERLRARRLVVTAGAWTQKLLGGHLALPRLVVTQEQPAHFAVRDESLAWPSFNHRPGADAGYGYWPGPVYGMLTPGEGLKVGWHGAGPEIDPDARDYESRAPQRDALRRYVAEWIPGADPDSLVDISCTYTSTDDSHFVLDRVGPVVAGAGFSGHGFKFTPAIGRVLADLATSDDRAPKLFSAHR